MEAAIAAGANIINDVSALSHDPQSVHIAAQSNLPVCLMHMRGTPETMQDNPAYEDIIDDLKSYFEERMNFCLRNGVKEENIILETLFIIAFSINFIVPKQEISHVNSCLISPIGSLAIDAKCITTSIFLKFSDCKSKIFFLRIIRFLCFFKLIFIASILSSK